MKISHLDRVYGSPADADGRLDREWYRHNIVSVLLPYRMRRAGNEESTRVRRVRFHRRKAYDLLGALRTMWYCAANLVACEIDMERCSQADRAELTMRRLQEDGLDLFGGAFCFRTVRGGARLSEHARGTAIDIDPDGNPLGSRDAHMPAYAIAAFRAWGFAWGGDCAARPDPMHFEAVPPILRGEPQPGRLL